MRKITLGEQQTYSLTPSWFIFDRIEFFANFPYMINCLMKNKFAEDFGEPLYFIETKKLFYVPKEDLNNRYIVFKETLRFKHENDFLLFRMKYL